MDYNPVYSIEIESYNNDEVDDGSTLSSRIESNRIVAITPNPKYKIATDKKFLRWEKTLPRRKRLRRGLVSTKTKKLH